MNNWTRLPGQWQRKEVQWSRLPRWGGLTQPSDGIGQQAAQLCHRQTLAVQRWLQTAAVHRQYPCVHSGPQCAAPYDHPSWTHSKFTFYFSGVHISPIRAQLLTTCPQLLVVRWNQPASSQIRDLLIECLHRRSQDFVWGGALFLTKKVDDLFLVVALKERLNTPPNQPAQQKLSSLLLWLGVHFVS